LKRNSELMLRRLQTNKKQSRMVFDQRKRDESKTFAESERAIADEAAQFQRDIQKAFADNERAIQAAAEQENRDIQKAFKDEQRSADLANAEAIKKILDSAKAKAPEARRSGGSVEAGEPYLVGEEGPELIYPNRAGYVATARETAAMMAIPSVGVNVKPNLTISDPKNLALMQELLNQTRIQNGHLMAIASRRPVESINKTTINNEYNTRSNKGLPR
jgi:hypothetical protein